ncbi:hypothetical protein RIF29_27948 [Crotalaria pallida]|uniref:GDT1 family protein n=1 Tax=Crotalaria pallida TaxID=3830 RepID=A0AAN9EQ12_CROPI
MILNNADLMLLLLRIKIGRLAMKLQKISLRLMAFSITFFGEWGDKSQLATICLAADENSFGVVLGGILLHSMLEFFSLFLASSHTFLQSMLLVIDCS